MRVADPLRKDGPANFRRALCASKKRRLDESPAESTKSPFRAPPAKKARTPSQEPESSEHRPQHLSIDALLQQPPTVLSPHDRHGHSVTSQPAQYQVHSFLPSPAPSPAPSSLATSPAFPPAHHRPSKSSHMQGHVYASSPRRKPTSYDEGSPVPIVLASIHVNHHSGEEANTGFDTSYGEHSSRHPNRSSTASAASNAGAGSLDRQPEERVNQEVTIDAQLQKLQDMTPERREEEFGQISAVRLKALFDANPWCKSHINRSRNASDILIAETIKRDQEEPCESPLFACYYCFEMYGKDKFSMDQPEHAIRKPNGRYKPFNPKSKPESTNIEPLRRFCMPCGVRLHFYRRFRRFESRTRSVWWVCRCWVLRLAPVADDGEPCPKCNLICPLRNPDEEDATFESDESDESDT